MPDLERQNLDAINSLNQRGGRMLSLVDLLDAGTLGLDMAAEMAAVVVAGGSFLTAAGPGGVGKTTLMGALLAFLPPGTEIVTIEGAETLDRLAAAPPDHPQCLVVHEIGAGEYYGYLWGPAVARYFDIGMRPGRSLASNLHAETYAAARTQLTGWSLAVTAQILARVDMLAFMTAARGKRRVTTVWRSRGHGAAHELTWQWVEDADRFERKTAPPDSPRVARLREFLSRAQDARISRLEDLRRRALAEVFTDQA